MTCRLFPSAATSRGISHNSHVIDLNQLMIGVMWGMALMFFGLVPGLFKSFAEGVLNCADALTSRSPRSSHLSERYRHPVWLAGIGAALIAVTLLAYFSK